MAISRVEQGSRQYAERITPGNHGDLWCEEGCGWDPSGITDSKAALALLTDHTRETGHMAATNIVETMTVMPVAALERTHPFTPVVDRLPARTYLLFCEERCEIPGFSETESENFDKARDAAVNHVEATGHTVDIDGSLYFGVYAIEHYEDTEEASNAQR